MLSEKEIEALKAGAYGVTRDGYKTKYIGMTPKNHYCWVIYNKDGTIGDMFRAYETFHIYTLNKEDSLDIVGLWKDKPEPFNLERALAGEPVLLENGDKAFVKFQLNAPVIGCHSLVGYRINENGREDRCSWFDDGTKSDNLKIIGMWK